MKRSSNPVMHMQADASVHYQLNQQTVACTRCHATEATLLCDLEDFLYGGEGRFAARQCLRCGLIYLSPRPTPTAIAAYYPDSYVPYRRAIQDEPNLLMRFMRRRRVRQRRRLVEHYTTTKSGRMLDVGASTGIFMDEMRSTGWQVFGIELSESAAAYARNRLKLDIICTELSQAHLPSGYFDLITLWDVIEHTFDPRAVLVDIHRQLHDHGIIALTIPSWESLDRRVFGRYWIGYDAPRHLHVFPLQVIEDMLCDAGFVIEENRTAFGGYFTFVTSLRVWLRAHLPQGRVRRSIERVIDLHGMRFLFDPLFAMIDQLGWGGVRVIVARKLPGEPGQPE